MGNVSFSKSKLSDVIVELKINKSSKFAVTNQKGEFKFLNLQVKDSDSIFIKINYVGYKNFVKNIKFSELKNILDIDLEIADSNILKEVIVKIDEKSINTARKKSYKINDKDYILNAKANKVLSTLPNINVSQESILVDGKLEAKIFIDGLETMTNELKSIDAKDIQRVEVINNPSSIYGSEFTGAIINIITKNKKEEFLKGSLATYGGIINNFFGLTPSISYKLGMIIFKSNFDYKTYNQMVTNNSIRKDNNGSFETNSENNTNAIQKYSESRLQINLTKKSKINFTNSLFSYRFINDLKGYSIKNEDLPINYFREGESGYTTWNISTVYNYQINESKNIFLKSNLNVKKNKDVNYFFDGSDNIVNDIQSKNKSITIQADYENEKLKIFNKESEIYFDSKYINRTFSFNNGFQINQNIFENSIELNNEWNDNFSTESSLTYSFSNNNNANINKNYTILLPLFNCLYHFKNKLDVKFGYSRKILRPNASDLNDDILIINPGLIRKGNSNLNHQIRNYYSIDFTKTIKKNVFSLKLYHENINNSIVEIYENQEDLLIQTFDNAAKYKSAGCIIGFKTNLLKKININITTGVDYDEFEDRSLNALIRSNKGFSFIGNYNISTKIFNDKISLSFSGRQNGPQYSLLSKRTTYPYLDFSLNTNFLNNKIELSLYVRNLLGKNASGFDDVSRYTGFYQRTETKNNSSNLIITLKYNFGKKFNDKIQNNDINNDDLRN